MFLKVVALLFAAFLVVTSAGLVGNLRDVDIDREDVQNALQFAVVQHNRDNNDVFLSQVSKVIKAQTQVVSGTNYFFTVEMARTSCKKGGVEMVCAIHPDSLIANSKECQLVVYNQPWTNTIKVTKNTCR